MKIGFSKRDSIFIGVVFFLTVISLAYTYFFWSMFLLNNIEEIFYLTEIDSLNYLFLFRLLFNSLVYGVDSVGLLRTVASSVGIVEILFILFFGSYLIMDYKREINIFGNFIGLYLLTSFLLLVMVFGILGSTNSIMIVEGFNAFGLIGFICFGFISFYLIIMFCLIFKKLCYNNSVNYDRKL